MKNIWRLQMNKDTRFLLIHEFQTRITKSKLALTTAMSRQESAKTRFMESLTLYHDADAVYSGKEIQIRQQMNAKLTSSPGFRVVFSLSLVDALQTKLEKHEQQLCHAVMQLNKSHAELKRAHDVLQAAETALAESFKQRNRHVPHVVRQVILPTAQTVATHELEYQRRQQNVDEARQLVEEKQGMVHIGRTNLARAVEAEKQVVEMRLYRKRQKADHEKMISTARQAMQSAERKVQEIIHNI